MSERVSRSIVVGTAWNARRVPSGDQLGAPLTVRLPCATSVARFDATSITHACERRKLSSNTCGSSFRAVFASSVLGSVSTARKAMREPSFDHSKPVTFSLDVVSWYPSPPSIGRTQICVLASVPGPREERNASERPSGDHCGAFSPFSLKVSWRGVPPAAGIIQRCDRISCLSPFAVSGFVESVDACALGCSQPLTAYAILEPSGDSATPPTFFSSMMSVNVMGRLFCAPAVAVAISSAATYEIRRGQGEIIVGLRWRVVRILQSRTRLRHCGTVLFDGRLIVVSEQVLRNSNSISSAHVSIDPELAARLTLLHLRTAVPTGLPLRD